MKKLELFGSFQRSSHCVFLSLGLLATQHLLATPTLINFDDRVGRPPPYGQGDPAEPQYLIDDEYLSRGVLFQSGGGGLLVSAPSNPVSSPNVVSGTEAGPAGRIQSYQVPITAEFFINGLPGFVDFVSLDLTSSTSLSTLSAYDQNGALLVSDSGAGPDTLLVRFTGHIHSVALTGGPFAFDNFTFDGLVAVPEPSVTALAASGAGVLVFLGWRKRRSNRR